MSIFRKIFAHLRGISAKQVAVAGVFTLAMAGAVTFGLANREQAEALNFTRDTSGNAMVHGGAANAQELVNKLNNNSLPNNQGHQYRTEAANFHKDFKLPRSEYSRFAKEALQCWAYRNDNTVKCTINGKEETVLTNVWSIGRWKKANSWAHRIDGKTYWADYNRDVFSSAKLPALVYFNKKGEVQYAALNACGNQIAGKKVKVTGKCEQLTKKKIGLNEYEFTTKASASRLGKVVKVEYLLDGKKIGQSTNSSNNFRFTHTFTKSGEVSAKVHIKVPGGHIIHVTDKCKTKITFKKPFYECKALVPTTRNDEETAFRFTVKTRQGNGAELRDVDFAIWKESDPSDVTTVTGVTQKDEDGNIYHEATFDDDGETRVIEATVNFNIADGVKSDKCKTKVTPKEAPKCPLPGKGHLPPDHPDCEEKPEEPEEPQKELPAAGAASMLGIFGSATGAGVAAHRLYLRRR